jgi:predicted nucleic acid-binding protein
VDAFDADVLIYAAEEGHSLGRRIGALLEGRLAAGEPSAGIGSILLLPEVMSKPLDEGRRAEAAKLAVLLGYLDLLPVDVPTADKATTLRSQYRLKTVDAVHLATAVEAGADRFITNNRRDFSSDIEEIDVVFPEDLPDPEG